MINQWVMIIDGFYKGNIGYITRIVLESKDKPYQVAISYNGGIEHEYLSASAFTECDNHAILILVTELNRQLLKAKEVELKMFRLIQENS